MNTRKIDMKCRIIIVELIKEGHATASIQEIMLSRHGINASKHAYRKLACTKIPGGKFSFGIVFLLNITIRHQKSQTEPL